MLEYLHQSEFNVKIFGNINMNYGFLFACIGSLISNLIFLIQNDVDSSTNHIF